MLPAPPERALNAEGERPRRPLRDVLAVVSAIAVVALVAVWWPNRLPNGGREKRLPPGFAGDLSCRDCHAGESARHARSGHARTLRPAGSLGLVRELNGLTVSDPERPNTSWRFTLRNEELSVDRIEAGKTEHFDMEYAFGSGRHAVTFVSLLDSEPRRPTSLEHRLTWFAHLGKPGLTPGQSLQGHAEGNTPHGRVHDSYNTLKCFGCHATVTSDRGPEVLDRTTMIPNIGCERCHGPAAAHVESARRGSSGPERALSVTAESWTAAEQMRACGECHRTAASLKPGDIRVDNPIIVRHQPVGLMQSACYSKSLGALSCVTCHDPHARTSKDPAAYLAVCLSCHSPPKQTSCRVSPRTGCVDCHMPKRHVTRGMMMSDHWIRIRPSSAETRQHNTKTPAPGSRKD